MTGGPGPGKEGPVSPPSPPPLSITRLPNRAFVPYLVPSDAVLRPPRLVGPMSESEGKQELTGLARSIDALFTRPPEASLPSGDVMSVVADLDPPAVGDATLEADAEEAKFDASSVEESVVEEPPVEESPIGESPSEDPAREKVQVGEYSAEEAQPEDSESEEPLLEEYAAEEPSSDVSVAEPPVADSELEQEEEEAAPIQEALEEVSQPISAPELAESDDDDAEAGPLDLAVEAYIGGQLEKADEIASLANELLENKEVDPIARAVFHLTLAAGSPPDSSVFAVADSIISTVVLGRLAHHMGSERDEQRRQEYYAACRVIGEGMAIAIRNHLADSTDRLARRIHRDALIAMGDASRAIIEEMAVDENRFLVRNAVAILGEIGGDRSVELVTSALANPDANARREALLALAKLGDEEAGELVVGLLEDPEPDVRIAAAIAAGELKVERALRSIISMLEASKDPDECLPLIRALGQLGDPGAVASIEKHAVRSMFSKPPTAVRIASYRALNSIGTPHARRLLNQAVSDKDPDVKAAVKELLHMR